MPDVTIVAGAFKIPNGFTLTGAITPAKLTMKAPDGKDIEFIVDMKSYKSEEFFESIDKFKEQVTQE